MKARKHFLGVVSDGRDNAHPRDDNPPHVRLALQVMYMNVFDGFRFKPARCLA